MASPRVVLYGPSSTPYTEKVIRALWLKGVAFRLVEPTSADDFRRWSPETGMLPVIEVDGTRVADSAAILDLLEARFPEPPLVAKDPKVAREQRRLEQWVGETFFFYLFRYVRRRLPADTAGAEGDGPRGPLARIGLLGPDGRPRAEFFDISGEGPGPEFERKVTDLANLLGARTYFFADRLSRADLAVFSFTNSLRADRYPGGRALLDRYPNLREHAERVDRETHRR